MYVLTNDGLAQAVPAASDLRQDRSRPEYIRWVQRTLNSILGINLKVDGIVGPRTRSTIQNFQQQNGLVPDGVVGAATEAALTDNSEYIRSVQRALNRVLGVNLKVDGAMGPRTRSAIRSFQQKQGLVADGVAGPRTDAALDRVAAAAAANAPARAFQRRCDWDRTNCHGLVEDESAFNMHRCGSDRKCRDFASRAYETRRDECEHRYRRCQESVRAFRISAGLGPQHP